MRSAQRAEFTKISVVTSRATRTKVQDRWDVAHHISILPFTFNLEVIMAVIGLSFPSKMAVMS